MVVVAQLVRALDCGSRGRGFKSHLPPTENEKPLKFLKRLFFGLKAMFRLKTSVRFNISRFEVNRRS